MDVFPMVARRNVVAAARSTHNPTTLEGRFCSKKKPFGDDERVMMAVGEGCKLRKREKQDAICFSRAKFSLGRLFRRSPRQKFQLMR